MPQVPGLGSRDFFVPRQLYRDHVKNLARDVTPSICFLKSTGFGYNHIAA